MLAGSANFTLTDTHANLNNVTVFHDKRVALVYRSQFDQLKAGEFGRGTLTALPPRDYLLERGSRARVLRARQHARSSSW